MIITVSTRFYAYTSTEFKRKRADVKYRAWAFDVSWDPTDPNGFNLKIYITAFITGP